MNFEGALGVEVEVRMSDPSAVQSVTSATGSFTIKLSEPMIDGDLISFDIGSLTGVNAGSDPSRAGTLILELAPDFNGLSLTVESLVFSVSGVEGAPNAVLNIEPTGGVQTSSGSGLPPTSPSSFANGDVDIQNGTGNNALVPQSLSVIAEGGSTVAVEIFGSNFEGGLGVQAQIRMSDPSAVPKHHLRNRFVHNQALRAHGRRRSHFVRHREPLSRERGSRSLTSGHAAHRTGP